MIPLRPGLLIQNPLLSPEILAHFINFLSISCQALLVNFRHDARSYEDGYRMVSGFKWALVQLEVAKFSLPFEGLICISYIHCGVSDYASSYGIETGNRRSETCQVKCKVAPVLIKRHAMKMYEGVETQRHVLLISGLRQVHASVALPLEKSHQNPLNWWLGGPQVTFPERKYLFPP